MNSDHIRDSIIRDSIIRDSIIRDGIIRDSIIRSRFYERSQISKKDISFVMSIRPSTRNY